MQKIFWAARLGNIERYRSFGGWRVGGRMGTEKGKERKRRYRLESCFLSSSHRGVTEHVTLWPSWPNCARILEEFTPSDQCAELKGRCDRYYFLLDSVQNQRKHPLNGTSSLCAEQTEQLFGVRLGPSSLIPHWILNLARQSCLVFLFLLSFLCEFFFNPHQVALENILWIKRYMIHLIPVYHICGIAFSSTHLE